MLVYQARPTFSSSPEVGGGIMERTTFSCSPEVGGGITHLSVIQPPTSSEQGQTRPMLDQYHQLNCTTLVIMTVVTCNSVSINICHQWRRPAVNDTRLLGYSLPCFLVTQSTTWLYFTCVPLTAFLRQTEILNCGTVWYPRVPAMLDQS